MTAPNNTLLSSSLVGMREDLSDVITLIAQDQTPFLSTIAGTSTAANTLHEWQLDSLEAVDTANYQAEGDDFAGAAVAQPTRVSNKTQILRKNVVISGTTEAVKKAGRKSEMARAMMKRMKEIKRDQESFLVGNQASTAGAPRKMGGLESWYTTNDSRGSGGSQGGFSAGDTVAATDGTQRAFTQALLQTALRLAADSGAEIDTVMLGTYNRDIVNTFTGSSFRQSQDTAKKVINTVDFYVGAYGQMKFVWNPRQRDRTCHLLDSNLVNVAYLRKPFVEDVAKTGDATKKQIIMECTLEVLNEAGLAVVADLTTS